LLRYIDAASSAARIKMIVNLTADITRPAETFFGPDQIGWITISLKNNTEIKPVMAI
jgi:hypothetical protein